MYTLVKKIDKTAIITKDKEISYLELLKNIDYFSTFYLKTVKTVAIFAPNSEKWIYAFYSAWKNNAIAIPIDFLAVEDEVQYILNDSKPEVVFYSDKTADVLKNSLKNLEIKPQTINLDKIDFQKNNTQKIESLIAEDIEKTAVIIYTSGTTGTSKGVMLSFKNLITNIETVAKEGFFTKETTTLLLLPLHHIFPLTGCLLSPLFSQGSVAITPSMQSNDILETLQKGKVTTIIAVPRFYEEILKGIKTKIDKSFVAKLLFSMAKKLKSKSFSKKIFSEVHKKMGGHILYLISGGAKLDLETAKDFETLGFTVFEGYGMTETAPMITFPPEKKTKLGSVGKELVKNSVKIVDNEILVKGPQVMQGYLNKPKETKEVIKNGWLHTGDLGYIDEEGFIFITGRKKEIIVTPNGKNINPIEIETKLEQTFPEIKEVGIFLKDNVLQAIFVPNEKKITTKDLNDFFRWEIVDKYNQKVQQYKRIMNFSITNSPLPRTRLEKLKRFKLPQLATNSKKEKSLKKEPDFKEYKIIKQFLEEISNQKIFPDDHVEIDLGMDSLDKVKFQVFIKESFGFEIDDKTFNKNPTPEKLAKIIREKKTKQEVRETNWNEILNKEIALTLPKSSWMHSFIKNFSSILLSVYFRIKIKGQKNIPQSPFILAPNHQSLIDGLFVIKGLDSKTFKETLFFAKGKHFQQSWRKFMAKNNNIIIMGIDDDLIVSLQKMASVLKQGKNLIIFPEGTRTRDGELQKFKNMFAILSKELNVPVVPVKIKGAFKAMSRHSKFPKPFTRIEISYKKPVFPKNKSYDEIVKETKKAIEN